MQCQGYSNPKRVKWKYKEESVSSDVFLPNNSTVSGTCLNLQVGQQMCDDTTGWGLVVLEAHSREQINEETIATSSEISIFL